MVNGIQKEFGRLETVMVKPAEAAAQKVGETFGKMKKTVATQFEMLVTDPNLASFFGNNPAAVGFYGGGKGGFTPEEAAAMGAGQFINFAGSGLATGRTFGAPITVNIHQPLGTPDAIRDAVGAAFTQSVMQGRKLSGS
jgi:hypothetical protein